MTVQLTHSYPARATATKARRRAAGAYERPSDEQQAAFRKYMSGGRHALSLADCEALASHKHLHHSQRSYFAGLAQERK